VVPDSANEHSTTGLLDPTIGIAEPALTDPKGVGAIGTACQQYGKNHQYS
jgi:hypothetical protein